MPPQIQALLQDKRMLAIIAGVLVVLAIAGFFLMPKGGVEDPSAKVLEKENLVLVKTKELGKAIEIQALLAREGVQVNRQQVEQDIELVLAESSNTVQDRDRALITLVQSGLIDRNVGLEAFDKGDLTASREEKRIKLVRAQQGELARLIRKIDPIEDASVSIAIPEQTMFRAEEKPISASVQVSLPTGGTLTRDKIRSIINLMVGSIQGLDAQHVALSDTAGNVYNSVLDVGSELNNKLEEQDLYMKQKVAAQLEKLVGSGHYVVTVSTLLREAPKETMTQTFDPETSTVASKQTFTENLNTHSGMSGGGPVSAMLPSGSHGSSSQNANKDYVRSGTEVSYANAKTQSIETSLPGMVEDISIAITIDRGHFPDMPMEQLQSLVAHAASPKVNPANVSVASVSFNKSLPGPIENTTDAPGEGVADMTWLYWALAAVGACFLVILILSLGKGSAKPNEGLDEARQELQYLRDLAGQQQAQLQATQQQTQMLLEAQKRQQLAPQESPAQITQQSSQLQQTLSELQAVVASGELEEEDLELQIKSWIESS